jgi:hypothetical protein
VTQAGDREWVTAAGDEMDLKDDEPSDDEKDLDFDAYDSKRSSSSRRSDGSDSGLDDEPPTTTSSTSTSNIRVGRVGDRSKSDGSALLADEDRPYNNNALAVGMSLNRAFVLRGSKMGGFRHDEV